ncbi:MAG: potassium transporter TrkG [Eubacteriales bacterium]|nr:potassium transporter TrkG [Eubacteriales bacterium]
MESKYSILNNLKAKKFRLTNIQVIVLGYFLVIMCGTFLLSLPFASKSRQWTGFFTSLFTATSATCVTGLVLVDTFTHWSLFGQTVIMCLIQLGGVGFMTIVSMVSVVVRRQMGLYQKTILQKSMGSARFSALSKLLNRVLICTACFEGAGTLLLCTRFMPKMGFWEGLYNAMFHSISAFCNAGFDLMGKYGAYGSMTEFSGDIVVNLTLMALIFAGGLGFLLWSDLYDKKMRLSKTSLQTRMVLAVTPMLILVPALLIFIVERNNAFAGMTVGEALMASLFQSVTSRTAGFNSIDLSGLSNSSIVVTIVLMMVGGNVGSTAGGIKITTVIIVFLGVLSTIRDKEHVDIGKRRFSDKLVRQANAIFIFYLSIIVVASLLIAIIDKEIPVQAVVFEVVSAIGTVGLTLAGTAEFSLVSKCILLLLMFMGRVGAVSLLSAFMETRQKPPIKRPIEEIMIG